LRKRVSQVNGDAEPAGKPQLGESAGESAHFSKSAEGHHVEELHQAQFQRIEPLNPEYHWELHGSQLQSLFQQPHQAFNIAELTNEPRFLAASFHSVQRGRIALRACCAAKQLALGGKRDVQLQR